MIRRLRLLLRENKVLRKGVYPFVRWIVLDVFKFKQRNIKRFGYEAVRLIDDAAKNVGVDYYAHYGTLLGFVREKGFISHDADMDFAIMPSSRNIKELFYALEQAGLYFERYILIDGTLKEFSMRYKEISIDFFVCRYFDETRRLIKNITENIGDCWIVLAEPVPSKLIPYTVHGVSTMIPENFDAILTACYGEWRVKVKKWDDRNSPCAQRDYTKHEHYASRSREEWVHFLVAAGC